MNSIYIFSQPVQSGKTTLLMQWLQLQTHAAGILVPVMEGKRMLFDVAQKSLEPIEAGPGDEVVEIGRFRFSRHGFEKAQSVLLEASHVNLDWLVVDEIGKLELHFQSGLEPAISKVIAWFKKGTTRTKLLLVIRDYLLNDAVKHYGLEQAHVVSSHFFEQGLSGLILCGGQSSRMGEDKSMISYHGKPQFVMVYNMISTFIEKVFLSCNSSQVINAHGEYPVIIDEPEFQNAGPMTGLLTAFNRYPGKSFLVMGCDYPFFTKKDLTALLDARDGEHKVVCYHNVATGFDEPLLAVYENSCAPLLLEYYQNGNTSLQQFLKTINTKRLEPGEARSVKSIDTKEEWDNF